jgi:hypothetical protein
VVSGLVTAGTLDSPASTKRPVEAETPWNTAHEGQFRPLSVIFVFLSVKKEEITQAVCKVAPMVAS